MPPGGSNPEYAFQSLHILSAHRYGVFTVFKFQIICAIEPEGYSFDFSILTM